MLGRLNTRAIRQTVSPRIYGCKWTQSTAILMHGRMNLLLSVAVVGPLYNTREHHCTGSACHMGRYDSCLAYVVSVALWEHTLMIGM